MWQQFFEYLKGCPEKDAKWVLSLANKKRMGLHYIRLNLRKSFVNARMSRYWNKLPREITVSFAEGS